MPRTLNEWVRQLFEERTVYDSVDRNESSLNMPGHFPGGPDCGAVGLSGESVEPHNRNWFNSKAFESYMRSTWRWFQFLVLKPIIIVMLFIFRLLAIVLNVVYFREAHSSHVINGTHINPIDKANKFVCDLEDNLPVEPQYSQYSASTVEARLPPFYKRSYTLALYMATNRAMFLFVYVTSPQNENSSSIFNKIILNPDFISLFHENSNTLIWGGDLMNPEAYQLANSLNVTKFPFLGLLCLTRTTTMTPQGSVKTLPKISLILKIQGGLSADINPHLLIDTKFKRKMAKYEAELSLMRNDLRDKFMSKALLKQQELNYLTSLALDRAKKLERQREALRKEYIIWKTLYFKDLIERNANGGARGDTARVGIKLQDGTRKMMQFPADSPVEDIFAFTEISQAGLLDETVSTSATSADEIRRKLANFQPTFKFKLVSPVPPKVVLNEYLNGPAGVTIRDIDCIYPNGLLLLES